MFSTVFLKTRAHIQQGIAHRCCSKNRSKRNYGSGVSFIGLKCCGLAIQLVHMKRTPSIYAGISAHRFIELKLQLREKAFTLTKVLML